MSNYKYNSEGKKFISVGNNLWVAEEDLPSREEIEQDKYRYTKPKIYISSIFYNILSPLLLFALVYFLFYKFLNVEFKDAVLMYIYTLLVYVFLRLRDIAIFAIRLYQKFAPEEVRHRCGYYPTCSDYMILAIKKYGLIIGIIKGVIRIKHCDGSHKEQWP